MHSAATWRVDIVNLVKINISTPLDENSYK